MKTQKWRHRDVIHQNLTNLKSESKDNTRKILRTKFYASGVENKRIGGGGVYTFPGAGCI